LFNQNQHTFVGTPHFPDWMLFSSEPSDGDSLEAEIELFERDLILEIRGSKIQHLGLA